MSENDSPTRGAAVVPSPPGESASSSPTTPHPAAYQGAPGPGAPPCASRGGTDEAEIRLVAPPSDRAVADSAHRSIRATPEKSAPRTFREQIAPDPASALERARRAAGELYEATSDLIDAWPDGAFAAARFREAADLVHALEAAERL